MKILSNIFILFIWPLLAAILGIVACYNLTAWAYNSTEIAIGSFLAVLVSIVALIFGIVVTIVIWTFVTIGIEELGDSKETAASTNKNEALKSTEPNLLKEIKLIEKNGQLIEVSEALDQIQITESSIQAFFLQLESDWSLNRQDKCIAELDLAFKKRGSRFIQKATRYFIASGKSQNPDLLPLTTKILSYHDQQYQDREWSMLISCCPLVFNIDQLAAIKRNVTNFHDFSTNSPLLMVYLAEQYDKYGFYIKVGYSENIPYKSVCTQILLPNQDKNSSVFTELPANTKFLHLTLGEVVIMERPELKLDSAIRRAT